MVLRGKGLHCAAGGPDFEAEKPRQSFSYVSPATFMKQREGDWIVFDMQALDGVGDSSVSK